MSCTHPIIEYDESTHVRVCRTCGLVIAESDLVEAAAIEGTQRILTSDKFWKQHKLIESICQRFGLGSGIREQAVDLFTQLRQIEGTKANQGKRGNVCAAICVLLANRRSAQPAALTLASLAGVLDEPGINISRVYWHLRKTVPSVFLIQDGSNARSEFEGFIERFISVGVQPVLKAEGLALESTRRVQRLADDICQLGCVGLLEVGRKPETYAMAGLFLALESAFAGQSRREGLFGKMQKIKLCEHTGVSYRTVQLRETELVSFFRTEGPMHLPWLVGNKKKSLFIYLDDLVNVMKKLGGTISEARPPAFDLSMRRLEGMKVMIEDAKRRLAGERLEKEPEEIGLVVERLLMKRVKEAEIEVCKDAGQLYDLLSLYEPINDDSDDDDSLL